MADRTSRLIVTLIDRVSGPASRAGRAIQSLTNRIGTVVPGTAAWGRSMERTQRTLQRMNSGLQSSGTLVGGMITGMALRRQYEFEKNLNRTQAILGIVDKKGFQPLRDRINEVAARYPAMRDEIAQGTAEMAMAGLGMDTIIATLENLVQGSMASGESIRTVGESVTDVIMGMALPFKTAAEQADSFRKVNDKLVSGATTYNSTYPALIRGLAYAAPIARAAGVSLHDTVAMLGTLADAGFKGEKGGVALQTSIINLAAATPKARAAFKALNIDLSQYLQATSDFQRKGQGKAFAEAIGEELGLDLSETIPHLDNLLSKDDLISNASALSDALSDAVIQSIGGTDVEGSAKIREAAENFVRSGFSRVDVMGILHEMAGADAGDNTAALAAIFGKRHATKMGALISGIKSGAYGEKSDALMAKTEGATERFAGIMQQGLVGAWARLTSAFDMFLEQTLVNTGVVDELVSALGKLRDIVVQMSTANPELLKFGAYLMLALPAMAAFGIAASGIGSAISVITGALGLLGGLVTGTLWPFVIALGAAAAAGKFFYDNWKGMGEAVKSFGDSFTAGLSPEARAALDSLVATLSKLWSAVKGLASDLGISTEAWQSFGSALGSIAAGTVNGIVAAINAIGNALQFVIDKANAAVAAMDKFFQGGYRAKGAGASIAPLFKGGSISSEDGTGYGGARAAGGPVRRGMSYLVGERGPEIFTPGASGSITPNNRIGSNVVLSPSFSFTTYGNADASDIEARVRRALNDYVNEQFRAAQGDVGLKVA